MNRPAWYALALITCACSGSPDESRGVRTVEAPAAARAPGAAPAGPAATAPASPAAPAKPKAPSPFQRSFTDPFEQHAYKAAVNGCYYYPPELLAKQFGTAADREAIARAYSTISETDTHREARYVGCLEGLAAPGAGNRKQFGQ